MGIEVQSSFGERERCRDGAGGRESVHTLCTDVYDAFHTKKNMQVG